MTRTILVIAACMTIISCSWGTEIVPWDDFQYVFDKDGRCNATIDSTKHHYILYTTEDNFRHVLSHTPEGKIDKIISENPSWQFLIYCKAEPSDSSKLIQLLNKHNCSFPVILDQKGEFLAINKIEPTYTMIGYICDKNGIVRGSSVIGTSQSFFDREFEYARYDINRRLPAISDLPPSRPTSIGHLVIPGLPRDLLKSKTPKEPSE